MDPIAFDSSLFIERRPRKFTKPKRPRIVGVVPRMCIRDKVMGRPGVVCMKPDPDDVDNMIAAAVMRFGRKMPADDGIIDLRELNRFLNFSLRVIDQLPTLPYDSKKTVETWFWSSSYNEARMRELVMDYLTGRIGEDWLRSESFIKDEGYDKPKPPRGINSPRNFSKVLMGPFIKAIEKVFFAMPWFVKGTDPRLWPQRLKELFGNCGVCRSDFTSFEAIHQGVFCQIFVAFVEHMGSTSGFPQWFWSVFRRMVLGTNSCSFKYIKVSIHQKLMSGVVWTSLANSLLNWLIMMFLYFDAKHPGLEDASSRFREFQGLVEGDDAIVRDVGQRKELADKLGVVLKLERYSNYSLADFCGIVCTPDGLVIPDYKKVLRNFFVLDGKYAFAREGKHRSLLRVKALSFKYLFGQSPVIGALCDWVLKETRGCDVTHLLKKVGISTPYGSGDFARPAIAARVWEVPARVTSESRQLCSVVFGLSVQEQLSIERDILSSHGELHIDIARHYDTDILKYSIDMVSAFVRDRPVVGFNHKFRGLLRFMKRPKPNLADKEFASEVFVKPWDESVTQVCQRLGVVA